MLAIEMLAPPEHSLPVPPASDRRVWTLDRPPFPASEHGKPWIVPLAHQYARVHLDGDRNEYEQVLFALQRRLSRAAVMAAATLDPAWVDETGDGVTLHNWCAWIHGNVLVAALRLVDDDPARRAMLVGLAVEGLDRYIASIPPDGAIDEGYSYWWNGACRAWEALDVLAHASGGELGSIPDSLRETVAFPHRMHLGTDWYVNHADGSARPHADHPWHALYRAARRVGDTAAQAHAAAHLRPETPLATESHGLGRLLRALTDPEWPTAGPSSSPLPRDVWLPSTQVLVARPKAGSSDGLTLAAKGGHNDEHHNHNDVGSVIVALDGIPVIVDAGRPTYTAQTFGPDRYQIWTMQSDWHNVPQIRGTAQGTGHAFTARDVSSTVDDSGTALSLDLAAAYPRDDIRCWKREARLHRDTGRITITDHWELDGDDDNARTRLHFLVAGTVQLHQGQAVITPLTGRGTVTLSWQPSDAPMTTTVRELDDPMLTDVWGRRLTRVEIDVTAIGAVGTFVLTICEEAS